MDRIFAWWVNQSPAERAATIARVRAEMRAAGRRPLAVERGQRFGQWTVLAPAAPRLQCGKAFRVFTCRCDCGRERPVRLAHLVNGQSRRCRACANAALRRRG